MIRLRNDKGKVIELSKNVKFIEICDDGGRVAAVVQQPSPDRVKVMSGSDMEFMRYIATFKLNTTQVFEAEGNM